jgi:uncharacterized protein YggE
MMRQRRFPIRLILLGVMLLATLAGIIVFFATRPATAQPSTPIAMTPPATAPAATRQATAQPTPDSGGARRVTVTGHGEVAGQPDTALVQLGVETQAATAKQALAQNTTQAAAVRARLADLGIAARDIQTSSFSMVPNYDEQRKQITGYVVTNILGVTIHKIDQAGTLLDQVVAAGANRIYGITFRIADQQALLAQARKAAVDDARQAAQQYAAASGASLGDIVALTEGPGMPPPLPLALERGAGEGAAPVAPGEQQIVVNVQVTFALK